MLRRIFIGIISLLVAGLLAAGWYAYNKGFTHKWRQFVIVEFRKRGVELSLRRLTLEPFRGIVARDVKVFDTRERKRTRAVINEVRLVINYANFFQGRPFIEALDLLDARLDVPLDPRNPNGTKLKVDHLSGRLFLPPQQVYLSHLDADLYGVHVTASGRVINPKILDSKNGTNAQGISIDALFKTIISELRTFTFEDGEPQLDIRFSGDMADFDKLFVEATLWAEKVRRGGYLLDSVYLNAGIREGVFRVKQLTLTDSRGTLQGSANFDVARQEWSFQLHSELDAQALTLAFIDAPALGDAVFYAPPTIDVTGRARVDDSISFQILGAASVKKFAYKTEVFDGFNADFSWNGTRWAARDVQLTHRTGAISGDVMESPNEFRQRLNSTIDPKILPPLLTGAAADWFQRLNFTRAADSQENPASPVATQR